MNPRSRRPLAFLPVLAAASLLAGCAECTQHLLAKGDFANLRPPTGEWQTAGDVRLSASDPARLEAIPGKGVIHNGNGRTVDILTTAEYGDVRASYEFNIPKGSNSGVYFMGRYEIQIFDSHGVAQPKHSDCGGIYQRWADDRGFEGHAPLVNAARPAGQWQTIEAVFRAPRFDASGRKVENARFKRVVLNGQVVQHEVEVTGPTRASHYQDEQPGGPMMIQGDHGPVAIRNLRITPLHLP